MARLGERFMESEGKPIEVGGKLVHMMHELPPFTEPATLRIEMRPGAPRIQGVRIKARGGKLHVAGQTFESMVLWTDTAPPEVTAKLEPASSRKPMTVRVWNVWRDGTIEQAWIGDAGLVVEEEGPKRVVLACSDGFHEPSFDDLRVKLTID